MQLLAIVSLVALLLVIAFLICHVVHTFHKKESYTDYELKCKVVSIRKGGSSGHTPSSTPAPAPYSPPAPPPSSTPAPPPYSPPAPPPSSTPGSKPPSTGTRNCTDPSSKSTSYSGRPEGCEWHAVTKPVKRLG